MPVSAWSPYAVIDPDVKLLQRLSLFLLRSNGITLI